MLQGAQMLTLAEFIVYGALTLTMALTGCMWWVTAGYKRERYVVPQHDAHTACGWLFLAAVALTAIVVAVFPG